MAPSHALATRERRLSYRVVLGGRDSTSDTAADELDGGRLSLGGGGTGHSLLSVLVRGGAMRGTLESRRSLSGGRGCGARRRSRGAGGVSDRSATDRGCPDGGACDEDRSEVSSCLSLWLL